jgi:predicted nucleic acid-binding protein
MKVVLDAGPIVALSKSGQLTLLPELFDEVIVPQSVIAEVAGLGEARAGAEIAKVPWAHVKVDAAGRRKIQERRRLGDGEAEAIALAQQDATRTYLLIDDDSGFKAAARLGIQTVRSGAVLVMAVEAGLITAKVAEDAVTVFRKERYISTAVERAILDLLHEVAREKPV